MERVRTQFQGVFNIVRFNWHFYLLALATLIALLVTAAFVTFPWQIAIYVFCSLLILSVSISLLVSYYVYDASGFYEMNWLPEISDASGKRFVNIHAGFDETSVLIQQKFKNSSLTVFDFYDPQKHTEVSIRRARAAYPSFPGTKSITTKHIPLADESVDIAMLIFAAHEIRDKQERIRFFMETTRVLRPDGKIILVEHLRDLPNFAAFNIGFFHFYSQRTWLEVVDMAGLSISAITALNPFVKLFVLTKK